MPRYEVFGYSLESDIELPELPSSFGSGPASWRIRTSRAPVPQGDATLLGTETVLEGVNVSAHASDDGLRLTFDDTGTFDVRPAARLITWHPGLGSIDVAVRADLLGRVLALAAHADGLLGLHASAVSIAGRAAAFLGPKHAGKSTLALALVRRGAKLLTDDTLVIRPGASGAMLAAPGVQRVRLWSDSARALRAQASGEPGAKPTVDSLTPSELESTSVPLAACYILESADPRTLEPIRCERMTGVLATVACVRFSKLGALAGGPAATQVLDRAAALTRAVHVFVAKVRRDLASLDDVADRIMEIHGSDREVGAVVAR